MVNRTIYFPAFTLIETMTAIMVSSIIFLGVLFIFTILNNKFELEIIRGELTDYCNYALDEVARSIRLADQISFRSYNNNPMIITSVNNITQDIYAISEDEGILKNGEPIHEEVEYRSIEDKQGISKHRLYYSPKEESGYIKYLLDSWEISILSDNIQNEIYKDAAAEVLDNSFLIKLHTKLVMDLDKDIIKEDLYFKRIAFSPGSYIRTMR